MAEAPDSHPEFVLELPRVEDEVRHAVPWHDHIALVDLRRAGLGPLEEGAAGGPERFLSFLGVGNVDVERPFGEAEFRDLLVEPADLLLCVPVEGEEEIRVRAVVRKDFPR
jgi:hypothetical protein